MPIVQSANGKSKSSNLCRSPRARPSHVAFYQEDGPFRIVMSAIPPYRAGEGSRFLTALQEAGINLLAFSGFPEGRGSQLDFVPADPAAFKQFARTAKWKFTGPKRAFLVSCEERVGAVAELHRKLAEAKINVTAIDAVCAGAGRYGAILWVATRDVNKTAKLLGAA